MGIKFACIHADGMKAMPPSTIVYGGVINYSHMSFICTLDIYTTVLGHTVGKKV